MFVGLYVDMAASCWIGILGRSLLRRSIGRYVDMSIGRYAMSTIWRRASSPALRARAAAVRLTKAPTGPSSVGCYGVQAFHRAKVPEVESVKNCSLRRGD